MYIFANAVDTTKNVNLNDAFSIKIIRLTMRFSNNLSKSKSIIKIIKFKYKALSNLKEHGIQDILSSFSCNAQDS